MKIILKKVHMLLLEENMDSIIVKLILIYICQVASIDVLYI